MNVKTFTKLGSMKNETIPKHIHIEFVNNATSCYLAL